jgi:tetratricopeptide (TPR) repeat protein
MNFSTCVRIFSRPCPDKVTQRAGRSPSIPVLNRSTFVARKPPVMVVVRIVWLYSVMIALLPGCSSESSDSSQPGLNADRGTTSSRHETAEIHTVNPGFAGIDQCDECHAERCTEFRQTRHFLASVPITPDQIPAGARAAEIAIGSHLPEHRFRTQVQGNALQILADRWLPDGNAASAATTVAFGYGVGGKADEVYFGWQDDELRELPVGWLHSHGCWGAQQFSDPHSGPDATREGTTRCLECHTTWFSHNRGSINRYRPESIQHGVTCERCHGPAEKHVSYHRLHPDDRQPHQIVSPSTFTRDQKMALCGQCHSATIFRRSAPFSYTPGEPLETHFRQHQNAHFEDDSVANQVKYLSQSRCFQQSDSLTCLTCHSPHHTMTPQQQGAVSCAQCHQSSDCLEQPRIPEHLRSECASCHMPQYARLAVRFHTDEERYVFPVRATQHRIGVYPESRDAALLDFLQRNEPETEAQSIRELQQKLRIHWLAQADQRQKEHRLVAAIGAVREAARFERTSEVQSRLGDLIQLQTEVEAHFSAAMQLQAAGRFQDAIAELQKLLQIKPDHAMAHAKIGTFLAVLNQPKQAREMLAKSIPLDPDNSYGHNMLGWLAYLEGDGQTAAHHFQQAEEIYPYTMENNYRWGLALMLLADWNAAIDRLSVAVEIAPEDPQVCAAMARCLLKLSRSNDALTYALRASQKTAFQDPELLSLLADVYLACENRDDAVATLQQALSTSAGQRPEVSQNLRRQLEEIRSQTK